MQLLFIIIGIQQFTVDNPVRIFYTYLIILYRLVYIITLSG